MTQTSTPTVRTTFVGATDFHGEKIRVTGPFGQLTVAYDYGAYDMHDKAVDTYLDHFRLDMDRPTGPDTHDNPRRRLSRSGRGYRYSLVPIDYSQDDDERHPDDRCTEHYGPARQCILPDHHNDDGSPHNDGQRTWV